MNNLDTIYNKFKLFKKKPSYGKFKVLDRKKIYKTLFLVK